MKNDFLTDLIKSKKAVAVVIAALLFGAALMIGGGVKKQANTDEISEYEATVENKIEQTVQAICGGKAYVIVTAEYGREIQYVKNRTSDSEQTVISSGSPVASRTAAPVIRGITVICRNGRDPSVCRKITDALSCAYGVSSARIYVTSPE